MSKTIHQVLFRTAFAAFLCAPLCVGAAPVQNDTLPMYGQPAIARSKKMQEADAAYIEQAAAQAGGDRKAAAAAELDQAEQAMGEADGEEAMRHYNRAWLLDPDNYQSFWGFGRILLTGGNVDAAIPHLDKAAALVADPDMKPLVLADGGIAYSLKASRAGAKAEKAKQFARANELFRQSTELNADYANGWLRWSQSLYREGKFADAWAKVKKARAAGGQPPKSYLKTLAEKMPEPKGD